MNVAGLMAAFDSEKNKILLLRLGGWRLCFMVVEVWMGGK
jgi:hypothetical protein